MKKLLLLIFMCSFLSCQHNKNNDIKEPLITIGNSKYYIYDYYENEIHYKIFSLYSTSNIFIVNVTRDSLEYVKYNK